MSTLVDEIIGSACQADGASAGNRVRALAWARVSTDMQEERGLSIPEQLRQIREYAECHGIEIVDEYQEAASAFKRESQRVEFHRMIERMKCDKNINAIVVHDLSRFSRDSVCAQILIRELAHAGVRVISVSDPEIDRESVAGVYLEHILLAKNEAYSREVSFHTKKGCRANVQTRDPETGWCYKNGGQPLFGYRAERLIRGEEKRGRPIIKCIWVPDDRVVAGKPVHEWARQCLHMAAEGASLDQLRDFCNKNGIPAPRQKYWGCSTWHSLLHTNCLLQYAGYGVWNVRGKNQRYNPPSEWVIVENAHEALITEEVARRIMEARKNRRCEQFENRSSGRAQRSRYLLSGGVFRCGRCGSNMIGFRKVKQDTYYLCGSQPNRRGLGCGPGVYVPCEEIEREVIAGLQQLISAFGDVNGFTRKVNAEINQLWAQMNGRPTNPEKRIADIDRKIENIRRAIEDGMPDTQWAYSRMRELIPRELSGLEGGRTSLGFSHLAPTGRLVYLAFFVDHARLW